MTVFFQVRGAGREHAPAQAKVLVGDSRHGALTIEYRGRALPFVKIAAPALPRMVEAPRSERQRQAVAAIIRRKAAAHHPWKQAARKGARRKAQGAEAGRDTTTFSAAGCVRPKIRCL